jgi:hypothetical protein
LTPLEGRQLPVTDGIARPEMPRLAFLSAGFACRPILAAFGGDVLGAVLGAGAAAFGHHRGALAAVIQRRIGVRRGQGAGGSTQTRKQQRATGGGDIGVPGLRRQDQRPVGQLLFAPPIKVFIK